MRCTAQYYIKQKKGAFLWNLILDIYKGGGSRAKFVTTLFGTFCKKKYFHILHCFLSKMTQHLFILV